MSLQLLVVVEQPCFLGVQLLYTLGFLCTSFILQCVFLGLGFTFAQQSKQLCGDINIHMMQCTCTHAYTHAHITQTYDAMHMHTYMYMWLCVREFNHTTHILASEVNQQQCVFHLCVCTCVCVCVCRCVMCGSTIVSISSVAQVVHNNCSQWL